jgi:hypothetical protein
MARFLASRDWASFCKAKVRISKKSKRGVTGLVTYLITSFQRVGFDSEGFNVDLDVRRRDPSMYLDLEGVRRLREVGLKTRVESLLSSRTRFGKNRLGVARGLFA